ncbi:type II toxin-antitoxin system VapC family toxin [Wenzhouxiangella sp. EGI_FJ10409]|uniref:type II toxin-antitoxin system VapC family toxin n=1 Tax=Wenzhouxiangella sp. EGI_FJ10409 TaxID=3243767 RepID=UPI0035DC4B59
MILIDLNVLLDILQERRPHFQASSAVVDRALADGVGAFIPAHAVTTIHYLVAKYGSRSSANRAVDWLLKHFQVAAVDSRVLSRARALNWPDFEDAVVAAAAEAHDCSLIVTRNVSDFRDSPVSARMPEEYLLITRDM